MKAVSKIDRRSLNRYVALGDSMSIDEYAGGPNLGAASLLYRNNDELYAEFCGQDLVHFNPSIKFHKAAWDGCTTRQLLFWMNQLPRSTEPTLLTLTIGGNDLLGWLRDGVHTLEAATPLIHDYSSRLIEILTGIHDKYPNSYLLLGNIYDPTDGDGTLQSGESMVNGLPILHALNEKTAEIARRYGARLVDIHSHFLGHGMRHGDPLSRHYNPEDTSMWFVFSIEPSARGSSEIRRLFFSAISSDLA